jgi:hypothetical protein
VAKSRAVCEEGTNGGVPHTRYVKWLGSGLPPNPWCAFFISCWDNAADRNHRMVSFVDERRAVNSF